MDDYAYLVMPYHEWLFWKVKEDEVNENETFNEYLQYRKNELMKEGIEDG